jgi:hypothetical protein
MKHRLFKRQLNTFEVHKPVLIQPYLESSHKSIMSFGYPLSHVKRKVYSCKSRIFSLCICERYGDYITCHFCCWSWTPILVKLHNSQSFIVSNYNPTMLYKNKMITTYMNQDTVDHKFSLERTILAVWQIC